MRLLKNVLKNSKMSVQNTHKTIALIERSVAMTTVISCERE